ncbi:MAG: cache domain-containing protein [Pseudomonadota bacterium]
MKINKNKKGMAGFIVFMCLFAFSASAVLATDAPILPSSSTESSTYPVLLAKKETGEPKKEILTYQKLMKNIMDQLFAVVESIEKDKTLTKAQQQKKILEFIQVVRWGPENKDSFFATDIQGIMLKDVYIPDLVGKDLANYTDPNGKKIFKEFIRIMRESVEGFDEHLWPKYEGKFPVPCIAYVRLFKPYDWVIGTRIFKDAIEGYEIPEMKLFVPLGTPPGQIPDHKPDKKSKK